MPIGPEEWKSGRTEAAKEVDTTVKERLLEFLELNAGKGYTADELAAIYARELAGEAIAGEDPNESHLAAPDPGVFARVLGRVGGTLYRRSARFQTALDELAEENQVETKTIETVDGQRTYYRVDRETELE